ncbi:hypothetical protein LTR17_001605 [Elasticomyces elasticus]|nr:hypothetical protein LTR17_001605 [Elasticomyces elasticus]
MAAAKPMLSADTQYHSVSTDMDQSSEKDSLQRKVELGGHPQMRKNRKWIPTVLLQAFFFLWIAPIMTLLVLNMKGYTIGASAWCPGGICWVDAFEADSSIPELNIHRFDKQGHNLLGILQLVAKLLEIWFELVAVALVYHYTMRLAAMKEGLPIGYLNRPNEFADLPGLFESLLWTSLPSSKGPQAYKKKAARIRVWAFIIMTVVLCFICNLIGPAIAVLLIPTLGWQHAPKVSYQTFSSLASANPPPSNGFTYLDTFSCTHRDLANYRYSCTRYDWAEKLDAWTSSWVVAAAESSHTTITQQDELVFTLNASRPDADGDYHGATYWIPSRQLVHTFSEDYDNIAYISLGYNATDLELSDEEYDSYVVYNKSQRLQVQRNGHILGTYPNRWYDAFDSLSWTTTIDEGRALQCYSHYAYGLASDNYTKCIQDGKDWGPNTKFASFTIAGPGNNTASGSNITMEVFASDHAAYFPNGTIPAGVSPDCLIDGTVPAGLECNWDQIFAPPTPDMANATSYITTIQATMTQGTEKVVATIDYIAYMGFTTYSLDPYPDSNPLRLVQTQSLPANGTAMPVDPAWTLATFSIEDGGVLETNRSTTQILHKVLSSILAGALEEADSDNPSREYLELVNEYEAIAYVPALQTLSIIEYSTSNLTQAKPTKAMIEDKEHPLLFRTALMYVWAYGMGSRTAILGVVVAMMGVAVVLAQFFLGIFDRKSIRSTTQLLVAALEHAPQGEFGGREHDEAEMARVRFHLQDAEEKAGKFTFHSTDLIGMTHGQPEVRHASVGSVG